MTLTLLMSTLAYGGNVTTTTTINNMYTYGEDVTHQNNDLIIVVANPVAGCEAGFWVSANDIANNNNISAFALSAFHASAKVYVAGDTDKRWSGSSGNYCKLTSIGLVKN